MRDADPCPACGGTGRVLCEPCVCVGSREPSAVLSLRALVARQELTADALRERLAAAERERDALAAALRGLLDVLGRCARCGAPATWWSGTGDTLCDEHAPACDPGGCAFADAPEVRAAEAALGARGWEGDGR